jgi:hypothetical protein
MAAELDGWMREINQFVRSSVLDKSMPAMNGTGEDCRVGREEGWEEWK